MILYIYIYCIISHHIIHDIYIYMYYSNCSIYLHSTTYHTIYILISVYRATCPRARQNKMTASLWPTVPKLEQPIILQSRHLTKGFLNVFEWILMKFCNLKQALAAKSTTSSNFHHSVVPLGIREVVRRHDASRKTEALAVHRSTWGWCQRIKTHNYCICIQTLLGG